MKISYCHHRTRTDERGRKLNPIPAHVRIEFKESEEAEVHYALRRLKLRYTQSDTGEALAVQIPVQNKQEYQTLVKNWNQPKTTPESYGKINPGKTVYFVIRKPKFCPTVRTGEVTRVTEKDVRVRDSYGKNSSEWTFPLSAIGRDVFTSAGEAFLAMGKP